MHNLPALGIVLNTLLVVAPMMIKPGRSGNRHLFRKYWVFLVWPILLTLSAGYASGLALLLQSDAWQQRLAPLHSSAAWR